MEILVRGVLFAGLLLHKLLWETLKKKALTRESQQPPAKATGKRIVKICKGLVLTFLLIQTLFLNLFPISDNPILLRIVGLTSFFAGLGMAMVGRLHLGENWVDLEDYQVLPEQSVVTHGVYRYIRHPIYSGDLLLLIGLQLALNSWLVFGVAVPLVVVVRQTLREEALLLRSLPGYDAYCARTKRFIPFVI